MVQSSFPLKAAALLIIAVLASASDVVSPKEALKDVQMFSYRIDEQSHGRDLGFFDLGWNFNMLMCKYLRHRL